MAKMKGDWEAPVATIPHGGVRPARRQLAERACARACMRFCGFRSTSEERGGNGEAHQGSSEVGEGAAWPSDDERWTGWSELADGGVRGLDGRPKPTEWLRKALAKKIVRVRWPEGFTEKLGVGFYRDLGS